MRLGRAALFTLRLACIVPVLVGELQSLFPALGRSSHTSRLIGFSQTRDESWNYNVYDRRGPFGWRNIPGYHACGGRTQSPINIRTSEVRFNPKHQLIFVPSPLTSNKYMPGVLNNTGKSPTFILPEGARCGCITGVPYRGGDTFCLVNVHVHFSSRNNAGSEHAVDGDKHAGEIHFEFFNVKYQADVASDMADGVTVIALFIKVHPLAFGPIPEYIEREVPKVIRIGVTAPVLFPSLDMLRRDGRFFTYEGSFTTPPCQQTIRWLVRPEPVAITPLQMAILRSLEADTGGTIARLGNIRPSRPRNNRLVEANFPRDSICTKHLHGN